MSLFNEASVTLTKELSKKTKKDQGIYFTPNSIVKYIATFLKPYNINSVLEPSCGSCEFLEHFSSKSLTAIENNQEIYNNVKQKYPFIIHGDFLQHKFDNTFDLVVGNPPYFVLPKKMVDKRYYKYFDGRPNIYIIFIIKSFELLNENGILAFVLPTNFLNCIYYNELRKYLSEYNILDIKITREKFLETSQEICIFIIQKTPKVQEKLLNEDFIVKFKNIVLFKSRQDVLKIKELNLNTTNLFNLGCKINIGTVIWNECKSELTDDKSKCVLIYNGDIKNNKLQIQKYTNKSKKNYIDKPGSNEKVILINRGYGTGKYTFDYCLIDNDPDLENGYLVENHCIVIHCNCHDLIIKSFQDQRTKQFIELVFSNNAINIQELYFILPIFLQV